MRSSPRQCTRGPKNALHMAAYHGSTRSTLALLSQGSFDVNQGCEDGSTPLMLASYSGSSGCVRALMDGGADVSIATDDGITALFTAAQYGNLAVTKMLTEAGADVEAPVCDGGTPLHVAADEGHSEIISALVEAGAKTGSRRRDGATPLYLASREGHTKTVRVLLRARADPLSAFRNQESGQIFIPLDIAALFGHSEVVRELLQQVGIGRCGGPTGGYDALRMASHNKHVGIMAMLTDAGVVDKGEALLDAVQNGNEEVAKHLVRLFGGTATSGRAYLDARDAGGQTALMLSILARRPCSPRIVRLLVDAGANTSSAVRVVDGGKAVAFSTPLAYVARMCHNGRTRGKYLTEQQRHTLEAIHSLLLREEAVHAVSWVWPKGVVPTTARAVKGSGGTAAPSTSLRTMLPILRRRTGRRRRAALLRAMFRHSSKNDQGAPTG